MGIAYIDEKGKGTVTLTLTEKVEDLAEAFGKMSFEEIYSESEEGARLIWKFIFSNDAKYMYEGKKKQEQ